MHVPSGRDSVEAAGKVTSGSIRGGMIRIAAAGILWGTVGVATRAIYELSPSADAISIGFWRLAFAAPVLLVACRVMLGPGSLRAGFGDTVLMMLTGGMMAAYQVLFYAAIAFSGVSVATLVTLCSAPIFVGVLSTVLLRERPATATVLSGFAALAGTALLITGTPAADPRTSLYGVLLSLGSALGYAAVTLLGRSFADRHHPLKITAIGFGFGAVLLLPISLTNGLVTEFTPAGWTLLSFLGAVPTALAYFLFLSGIRTTPAAVASIVTLLEPLTAAVLAFLIFGERLGTPGLVGAALLMSSLVILYRTSNDPT